VGAQFERCNAYQHENFVHQWNPCAGGRGHQAARGKPRLLYVKGKSVSNNQFSDPNSQFNGVSIFMDVFSNKLNGAFACRSTERNLEGTVMAHTAALPLITAESGLTGLAWKVRG